MFGDRPPLLVQSPVLAQIVPPAPRSSACVGAWCCSTRTKCTPRSDCRGPCHTPAGSSNTLRATSGPDQADQVAQAVPGQPVAEHVQGIAEVARCRSRAQPCHQVIRHPRRVGVEHLVEGDRGRTAVALAVGREVRPELRLGGPGLVLAQYEAHLLHQMLPDHRVPVQAAPVRLAQQHLVVDRGFDQRAALLVAERPRQQFLLPAREIIDARPLDHDRLPGRWGQQVVGHEQQRGERQEVNERLAAERVPETSGHRVGGTSQPVGPHSRARRHRQGDPRRRMTAHLVRRRLRVDPAPS